MNRLLLVLLCPALLAFAPVPNPRVETDPDKAIEQYDKEVQALHAKMQQVLEGRRKKLIEQLKQQQADLEKKGKRAEAGLVRDRLVFLDSVDAARPLGAVRAADAIKKASVNGKYRHLLRVLYLPGDANQYTHFRDYGMYTGTSYAGYNDLPVGYWVYSDGRWYIWRDAGGG